MKANAAAFGILVTLLLTAEAQADQKELRIEVGDRIRYRVGTGKTFKAVVREADPDWLLVEDKQGNSRRLPKSALESLGVLRGKKRNVWGGAMLGFLPGAAFGVFAVGVMCDEGSSCGYAGPALVLGSMTAVVGAGVGALIKTDRWQHAPVSRVRFGLAPTKGGGVRAALSLSF